MRQRILKYSYNQIGGTKDYDSPFCGGLVFCTQFKNTFALSILTYPKNSNHKQVYAVYVYVRKL